MINSGEIAAIKNCTLILTDPKGDFRLTPSEAQDAFAEFSLYTNAESCPMVSVHIEGWIVEAYLTTPQKSALPLFVGQASVNMCMAHLSKP